MLTVAFDSEEATWFRTSLDKDGRLEPPPPGIPLTLVFAGTAAAGDSAHAGLRRNRRPRRRGARDCRFEAVVGADPGAGAGRAVAVRRPPGARVGD